MTERFKPKIRLIYSNTTKIKNRTTSSTITLAKLVMWLHFTFENLKHEF